MNGKLRVLPISNADSVTSLRLVSPGGVKLALEHQPAEGSSTVLLASLDSAGNPETLSGVTLRSSMWDAAGSTDGTVSFVAANPESATIWLSYMSTKPGSRTMVTRRYRSGYFGAPHFIKGAQQSLAITSILDTNDTTRVVMFSRDANGEYGEYRELPFPHKGELLDALLLRVGAKYVLLSKFLARSGAPRSPGILYSSELDSGFREIRPAELCLNGREIFDFDADVSGETIVLFAATEHGYVLTSKLDFSGEETKAGVLTSPSVLLDGGKAYLAAIEDSGTLKAKVLIGAEVSLE